MSSVLTSPGPLLDRDDGRDTWRRQEGVVKFLEFPVRKEGMSHREFHLYWQRHHSPHVMNVTGFSRYIRKYVSAHAYDGHVQGLPLRFRQETPFDGASELWINGLDEIASWLSHPQYEELIRPDELRFLSQEGKGRVLIAREERVLDLPLDDPESGLVRLYLQLESRSGVARDAFHSACSDFAMVLANSPSTLHLRQVILNHMVDGPLPLELPAPGVDVVMALGFDTLQQAKKILALQEIEKRWDSLEGLVTDIGNIPALVTRLCVVHDEFTFQPTTMQARPFSWDSI